MYKVHIWKDSKRKIVPNGMSWNVFSRFKAQMDKSKEEEVEVEKRKKTNEEEKMRTRNFTGLRTMKNCC